MFFRKSLTVLALAVSPFLTLASPAQANTAPTDETSMSSMAKALEINRLAVALRLCQKKLAADKNSGATKDVIDADMTDLRSKESAFHRVAGLD